MYLDKFTFNVSITVVLVSVEIDKSSLGKQPPVGVMAIVEYGRSWIGSAAVSNQRL